MYASLVGCARVVVPDVIATMWVLVHHVVAVRISLIVRDADRLESLGAIGILRWAITATIRRTPQTRTYHPADPFAEQHEPDDSSYMLDHFFTKLLMISDSMATETGHQMARRRVNFMLAYLDELRSELDTEVP